MLARIPKSAIFFFFTFLVAVLFFVISSQRKNNTQNSTIGSIESTPVQTNENQESVPLPSKEHIIKLFCDLINEGRIAEAVSMMDLKDDTERQTWAVSFNNFSSFKLVNLKKSALGDENSFEADIDVVLKKNLSDLPIPNYGWENGINKRWINVVEVGSGRYKIAGISTGP